jgi:NitT/TauT family transport system ATP-binding protein
VKVEINDLSHTFIGKQPRLVLQDLNFEIPSGQFTALIGPSGCGKSTLLRLIANLLTPSRGRIRIGELSPSQANQAQKLAWMAQNPALLPWLNTLENVNLASRLVKANGHAHLSARQALERVGLAEYALAYPATLSGGMQQRAALARLITQDAGLWLMDEPFAALDEITREKMAAELLALWQPLKPTVLWVTHNIYEALRLADRILVFSQTPANIILDCTINLPRPRVEGLPAFQSLLSNLRTALGAAMNPQAVQM